MWTTQGKGIDAMTASDDFSNKEKQQMLMTYITLEEFGFSVGFLVLSFYSVFKIH